MRMLLKPRRHLAYRAFGARRANAVVLLRAAEPSNGPEGIYLLPFWKCKSNACAKRQWITLFGMGNKTHTANGGSAKAVVVVVKAVPAKRKRRSRASQVWVSASRLVAKHATGVFARTFTYSTGGMRAMHAAKAQRLPPACLVQSAKVSANAKQT